MQETTRYLTCFLPSLLSLSLSLLCLSCQSFQSVHFSLEERNWRRDSGLANQRAGCETRANEAERDRNRLAGSLLLVPL